MTGRFRRRYFSLLHLFLSMSIGIAFGIEAAPIYPHELAYDQAPHIVQAQIISFDPVRGAVVESKKVVRGALAVGRRFYLRGTGHYPFLNVPRTNLTLFVRNFQGDEAVLWQGPTSGGIIWEDHQTLGLIATASADPHASLTASHPRERLAASYYLTTRGGFSTRLMDQVVRSLIWGLAQQEPEINQAALDAFEALEIDVQMISGSYHPGFRAELKQAAATKMQEWWEQTE